MALATATIATIGLAISAGGLILGQQQARSSQRSARSAAEEASRARAEESAQGDRNAAQERRQQIREERIKRAQIMNQAALTGTSNSSGEAGAIGGMASQLGSNLGMNQGSILRGQRISGFMQNQSDFMTAAQSASNRAGTYRQVGQLGGSLFAQAGGWSAFGKGGSTQVGGWGSMLPGEE